MVDKKIGFITGGNAFIIVNGKKMAFSQDVSYSVNTATVPVECMGKYEVITNEPISYQVGGSFSIVRYLVDSSVSAGIPNISASGTNSPGIWANSQLNPGKILNSATFEIEIFQKTPGENINTTSSDSDIAAITDVASAIKLIDCRITRRSGAVNKRGVFVESFNFVGILFNDDQGVDTGSSSGLVGDDIV